MYFVLSQRDWRPCIFSLFQHHILGSEATELGPYLEERPFKGHCAMRMFSFIVGPDTLKVSYVKFVSLCNIIDEDFYVD